MPLGGCISSNWNGIVGIVVLAFLSAQVFCSLVYRSRLDAWDGEFGYDADGVDRSSMFMPHGFGSWGVVASSVASRNLRSTLASLRSRGVVDRVSGLSFSHAGLWALCLVGTTMVLHGSPTFITCFPSVAHCR